METYARFWLAGASTVTAVGLIAAAFSYGLALMSMALAFTGGLAAFVHWARLDRPAPDLASAIGTGAAIGAAVVGSVGFALWQGGPGLLLVLILALLSPGALDAVTARGSTRRRVRGRAWTEVLQDEKAEPADGRVRWTSELTNRDLCDGWCASYLALYDATSTEQKIRIVLARKDYLDEIEARNQPAFRRWLANEPRASSSPARLLADLPDAPAYDEEP